MKNGIAIRGIVFSALFGALLVVLSFLKIDLGFTPVPIAMETMGVMLAGAFLGARYGFISILTVAVLTALGVPLLGGQGGIGLILGPTGGFIWMFPISACFIGLCAEKIKGGGPMAAGKMFLAIFLFGSLLLYVSGVPWLAYKLHVGIGKALVLGCYPFLPGDLLKAVVTTAIVMPIRRVYPVWKLVGSAEAQVAKF
ncbi:MAG TPA: biotin transporter BioY [Bacilli bacterium]